MNNPPIRNLFKLYAQLIALHLDMLPYMDDDQAKKMEHFTVLALKEQLSAVNEQTGGVNARKLADRDYKQLTATVEKSAVSLKTC